MHVSFVCMQITFADMQLDTLRFLLSRSGSRVRLRPKAFDLLIYLVDHRGRVVPRFELVRLLWGETVVGPGSLSGLVNELRTALGERGDVDSSIRTIHARGYQFVAEVRVEDEDDSRGGVVAGRRMPSPVESLPQSVVEHLRGRMLTLLRREIRPLVESEGLEEAAFEPLLEALVQNLSVSDSRPASPPESQAEPRDAREGTRPERRMRVARPASQSAYSDEGRRDAG